LRLYRTVGGKFVCQRIGRTYWLYEDDSFSATVAMTIKEVIGYFGHGSLAECLYEHAKIDTADEIA
jgi:hypothetical protein